MGIKAIFLDLDGQMKYIHELGLNISTINSDNIVYETEKLLYDKIYRQNIICQLNEVKDCLSDKCSAKEVANELCKFL